jgi:hypothetical protein
MEWQSLLTDIRLSSPNSSETRNEDICISAVLIHTVQMEAKAIDSACRYPDLSRNPTQHTYPVHRRHECRTKVHASSVVRCSR